MHPTFDPEFLTSQNVWRFILAVHLVAGLRQFVQGGQFLLQLGPSVFDPRTGLLRRQPVVLEVLGHAAGADESFRVRQGAGCQQ